MNKQIYHPHDKFFNAVMSHKKEAVDFFKNYRPGDIQKFMDFNTLLKELLNWAWR
ncbi:MAG: Rpn family recombination-promoting nuclease/putative transposase [bacterium]